MDYFCMLYFYSCFACPKRKYYVHSNQTLLKTFIQQKILPLAIFKREIRPPSKGFSEEGV